MASKLSELAPVDDAPDPRFRRRERRIDPEAVLAALDDPDSRRLLEATTTEALTVGELVERCEIPQSTVYRKVEQLTGAGLLEERIRIRGSGNHVNEYRRAFEDVTVSLSAVDGFEVGISTPESESLPGD